MIKKPIKIDRHNHDIIIRKLHKNLTKELNESINYKYIYHLFLKAIKVEYPDKIFANFEQEDAYECGLLSSIIISEHNSEKIFNRFYELLSFVYETELNKECIKKIFYKSFKFNTFNKFEFMYNKKYEKSKFNSILRANMYFDLYKFKNEIDYLVIVIQDGKLLVLGDDWSRYNLKNRETIINQKMLSYFSNIVGDLNEKIDLNKTQKGKISLNRAIFVEYFSLEMHKRGSLKAKENKSVNKNMNREDLIDYQNEIQRQKREKEEEIEQKIDKLVDKVDIEELIEKKYNPFKNNEFMDLYFYSVPLVAKNKYSFVIHKKDFNEYEKVRKMINQSGHMIAQSDFL